MKHKYVLLTTVAAIAVSGLLVGCAKVARARTPTEKFNRDSESLILGLQQYKEFTGSYPPGNNVAIAKALLGQDGKKVLILAVRQNDLNDKGEIVDAWGTPFRFYFSGTEVLIRSAGPNQIWEDDANPQADDLYRSNLAAR